MHHALRMNDTPALLADDGPTRAGLLRRLLWTWLVFWLFMFVIGTQEYLWSGGRQLWRPLVDYGSAAFIATVLAAIQVRRAPRYDALFDQPMRWFAHMWAWLPLQLVVFVVAMYGVRWMLYTLAGVPYRPGNPEYANDSIDTSKPRLRSTAAQYSRASRSSPLPAARGARPSARRCVTPS